MERKGFLCFLEKSMNCWLRYASDGFHISPTQLAWGKGFDVVGRVCKMHVNI
jgi:hypothetical protein